MASLKEHLKQAVKNAYPKMLNIEKAELFIRGLDYKVSNGERRLRELSEGDYPVVKPVKNDKGYIRGYVYLGENDIQEFKVKPKLKSKQAQLLDTTTI